MTYEEQKLYTDILRAQLSKHELALFFYNVFYFEGNGKGKMYRWAKEYNIFKHIDEKEILVSDRQKLNQIFQAYQTYRDSMSINLKSKNV